jgi:cytochrome c-type biogenesis protein CcsB
VTTEAMASFSDTAIMFAGIVYVLALLAHITEWAVALTRAPSADVVTADEPVSVGAGAGPGEAPPAAPEDEQRELRIDTFSRIGVSLTVVAAALHLAGVVSRAFATEPARVPWGNMYEFTVTGALSVTLIYLALLRRLRLRWMGLFLTLFEVIVLMLANLTLEQQAGPLVPSLHSYWLVIHVGAAILATGAFAVGALTSAMFLVRERMGPRWSPLLQRIPDADSLDRLSYRVHAIGFPLWTFAALIAGPIWAEYAWGAYWNWDPKEIWAFITWVVYAAYLHARATAGWKGRAAAIIALIGFATLLFNFVGINFFFGASSMHSYA